MTRALISELVENRVALLRRKRTRLSRSAWDAARAMPMNDDVFAAVSAAYVAINRVGVVMDVSLARSAGEAAGSFQEVMKTGAPINYMVAVKPIEAALAALGVHHFVDVATGDE